MQDEIFNSILSDNILDIMNLTTLADNKLSFAKMMGFVCYKIENNWEKKKILMISMFFFHNDIKIPQTNFRLFDWLVGCIGVYSHFNS